MSLPAKGEVHSREPAEDDVSLATPLSRNPDRKELFVLLVLVLDVFLSNEDRPSHNPFDLEDNMFESKVQSMLV
jgi:hypothetical protein